MMTRNHAHTPPQTPAPSGGATPAGGPEMAGLRKRPERIPVDIPVLLTSVLTETGAAVLSDLTEQGALIVGASLPPGTQFHIEYAGQTVYGIAVWTEHDRFGARFPFALHDGPLHRRLEQARADHASRRKESRPAPAHGHPAPRPPRAPVGFGRRGTH